MIGISKAAEKLQAEWEQKDRAAWEAAAIKLEAQGYTCHKRNSRLPIFCKVGEPDLILVRQLGNLNWYTMEL